MTIVAGIFSWADDNAIHEIQPSIRSAISRDKNDQAIEHCGTRCYLVKIDIGAHLSPAHMVADDGSAAMLAGDPILEEQPGKNVLPREQALQALSAEWATDNEEVTRQVQGAFCAAHIDSLEKNLSLINDKLGQRPFYYYLGEGFIVFASALRILESLHNVPKSMDFRSVCELGAFGCCLADRTQYAEIKCLGPGQILRTNKQGELSISRYWAWEEIERTALTIPNAAEKAYELFMQSVARRTLDKEHAVSAFLSGGLDSRIIVSALRQMRKTVHSFNMFMGESLDKVLSALAADVIGANHHAKKIQFMNFIHPVTFLKDAQQDSFRIATQECERPMLVWSGDGGSVGMGGVYLNEEICSYLEKGNFEQAAEQFLKFNQIGIPAGFLSGPLRDRWKTSILQSLTEQLASYNCQNKGNEALIFLLMNDQRRHLFAHLEQIDIDRRELVLPCFDSDLLVLFASLPMKEFIYHRFYDRFYKKFPANTRTVPWQTYPDHVECPLPTPDDASYQWKAGQGWSWLSRSTWEGYRPVLACSIQRDFPHLLLSRPRVLLAGILSLSGIRDYRHVLKFSGIVIATWKKTKGTVTL